MFYRNRLLAPIVASSVPISTALRNLRNQLKYDTSAQLGCRTEAAQLLSNQIRASEPTFVFDHSSTFSVVAGDAGLEHACIDVAVFLSSAAAFDAITTLPRVADALVWVAKHQDQLARFPARFASIALNILQLKDGKSGGAAFVVKHMLQSLRKGVSVMLARSKEPRPAPDILPPSASRPTEDFVVTASHALAVVSRLLETDQLHTHGELEEIEGILQGSIDVLVGGGRKTDLHDFMTMCTACERMVGKCQELGHTLTTLDVSESRSRIKTSGMAALEPPVGAILDGNRAAIPKVGDLASALLSLSRLNDRDVEVVESIAALLPQQIAVAGPKDVVTILQSASKLAGIIDKQTMTRIVAALRPRIISLLSNGSRSSRFRHGEASTSLFCLSKLKVDIAADVVKVLITSFCWTAADASPSHIVMLLQGLLRLTQAQASRPSSSEQSAPSSRGHGKAAFVEVQLMVKVFERIKDCLPMFKGDEAAHVLLAFSKLYPPLAFSVFELLQPLLQKSIASPSEMRLHSSNQVFAALGALAECPTTNPDEERILNDAQKMKILVSENASGTLRKESEQAPLAANEVVVFVSNVLKEALKNEDDHLAAVTVAGVVEQDDDTGGATILEINSGESEIAPVAAVAPRVTLVSTLPLLIGRTARLANAYEVGALSRSLVRIASNHLGTKDEIRSAAAELVAAFSKIADQASVSDTIGVMSLASRFPSMSESSADSLFRRLSHLMPATTCRECLQLAFHASGIATWFFSHQADVSDTFRSAIESLTTAVAERGMLLTTQLTASEAALLLHCISVFRTASDGIAGDSPMPASAADRVVVDEVDEASDDNEAAEGGATEGSDGVAAFIKQIVQHIATGLKADPTSVKSKELVMFLRAIDKCGILVPHDVLYTSLEAAKALAPTMSLQDLSLVLVVFSHLGVWNARVMNMMVECALDTVAGSTIRQCTSTLSALIRSGFINRSQSFLAKGLSDRGVLVGSSKNGKGSLSGNSNSSELLCTAICDRLILLLRTASKNEAVAQGVAIPLRDVHNLVAALAVFEYPPRPLFDSAMHQLSGALCSSDNASHQELTKSSAVALRQYWRCSSRREGEQCALRVLELFKSHADVPRSLPIVQNTLADVAEELANLPLLLNGFLLEDDVVNHLWSSAIRQSSFMNAAGFVTTYTSLCRLAGSSASPNHSLMKEFALVMLGNSKVFVGKAVIKRQHWSLEHTAKALSLVSFASPRFQPFSDEVVQSCKEHFLSILPMKSAAHGDDLCNGLGLFIIEAALASASTASSSSAATAATRVSALLQCLLRKESSVGARAALQLLFRVCSADVALIGSALPRDTIRLLERRIVRDIGAFDKRGLLLGDVARLVTLKNGDAIRAIEVHCQHQLGARMKAFVEKCAAAHAKDVGAALNSDAQKSVAGILSLFR